MNPDEQPLLAPTFLFRFAVPCLPAGGGRAGVTLDERHRIPCFGELEGRPAFADLRLGWNAEGLWLTVTVTGKQSPAWCREGRVEDSDGLQLLIDTRDTHDIHRASRFCHRFALLPFGGGRRVDEPVGQLLPIQRARELPRPVDPGTLQLRSARRPDGYSLQAHLPAGALTGFDPQEHPRLGFSYAVIDRELGWQTLTLGNDFPILSDPSLWSTLELVAETPDGEP